MTANTGNDCNRKSKISVVIPVFNEEANVDELVTRCLRACEQMQRPFEVILVDDGSTDASPTKIEAMAVAFPDRVVGLFLNRNYGQHAAIRAGLAQADGAIIVTLDADLQNPPEEIPRIVDKMDEGFDVVGSIRVPRCDSFFRRVSSYLVNRMVQTSTGVMMHDYGCMLRGYRRHIVDAILACREQCTFIPILGNTYAGATAEIDVQHEKRRSGISKYSVWKLINLQFDLLTCMTTTPLRLLSVLGLFISAAGIGGGMLLLLLRLYHGPEWAAEGVFTLFSILFIFIGAQFIGMGLLGEYIGRIYNDVRARPPFHIQKFVGHKP